MSREPSGYYSDYSDDTDHTHSTRHSKPKRHHRRPESVASASTAPRSVAPGPQNALVVRPKSNVGRMASELEVVSIPTPSVVSSQSTIRRLPPPSAAGSRATTSTRHTHGTHHRKGHRGDSQAGYARTITPSDVSGYSKASKAKDSHYSDASRSHSNDPDAQALVRYQNGAPSDSESEITSYTVRPPRSTVSTSTARPRTRLAEPPASIISTAKSSTSTARPHGSGKSVLPTTTSSTTRSDRPRKHNTRSTAAMSMSGMSMSVRAFK
ncbi:hypothetical protein ACMFMG_001229 [Clarireedia jacksonii]